MGVQCNLKGWPSSSVFSRGLLSDAVAASLYSALLTHHFYRIYCTRNLLTSLRFERCYFCSTKLSDSYKFRCLWRMLSLGPQVKFVVQCVPFWIWPHWSSILVLVGVLSSLGDFRWYLVRTSRQTLCDWSDLPIASITIELQRKSH